MTHGNWQPTSAYGRPPGAWPSHTPRETTYFEPRMTSEQEFDSFKSQADTIKQQLDYMESRIQQNEE